MSYVKAYGQLVEAEVDRTAWTETYFSLLSLKGHMQALPGWISFDLWARDLENDNIRLVAVTTWESADHLATWLHSNNTTDAILRAMEPPPATIMVELYEEII